jgi:hypothetical protein
MRIQEAQKHTDPDADPDTGKSPELTGLMSPVPKVGKVDAVVGADVLCEGGILPLTAHSGPQASQHTTRSAASSTGGAHRFSFLPLGSGKVQAIIILRPKLTN